MPSPGRPKRTAIHGDTRDNARYVFGYYAHGGFGGICRKSFELPTLVEYLNKFLMVQVHDDLGVAGKWNAINVLRNAPTKVHTDNNNYANTVNYSLSTGPYVGGELWIQQPGGGVWKEGKGGDRIEGTYLDNYQKATMIDPKRQHAVEEWSGTRWALVAYTTRNVMNANSCEREALHQLGFQRSNRVSGLWKRAAELSVLFTTLTTADENYANEEYQVKPTSPKVAMLEIGDVTATCYAADVLEDRIDIAEPVLWEDYEWRRRTGHLDGVEQLWIHVDEENHARRKDDLNMVASQMVDGGKTVIFENNLNDDNLDDNPEAWKEIRSQWEDIMYDVSEDQTPEGRQLLRVKKHSEEKIIYVGETVSGTEEEKEAKPGATGITFKKGVPPHIASALRRAHQNLGHPSTADFVRHLRVAGAGADVLRAAGSLKCETCIRTQAPSISRPAAIANVLQFNQVVGADLLYVHDVNGKKHEMLSIVDFSSSYHVVVPVARKDTHTLEQAFCHNWVNVFGAPGTIAIDLENGLQKALARTADWTGMAIRSCGLWKAIFNRVSEDKNVTQADIALAVGAVSHAKNTLRKVSGYSPAQHVFGQTPAAPDDLIDGPMAHLPEGEVVLDDKHAREVAMRTAARAAFHFVQTDDRVRRALQGRSRVQAREPNVGDRVFFFRKAKNSKRGWWRGPATVIGKESTNFWVSRAGRCLLCAPEHVRVATNQELGHMFSLRASREDLDKLLNADYDDKHIYEEEEAEAEHAGDDLEMEEVAMENEDVDVDEKGTRRPDEGLPKPVLKRVRMKTAPSDLRHHEAMMLKKAKTARSRAKQLEKELPWQLIPADKRDDFRAAEDKQWKEHMDHDALAVLSVEESIEVEATTLRERILTSRWAYRDKALAQRRTKPETPWRPKARLVIGGHEDPDLAGGNVVSDSPTVARATLILLLQICCSRSWTAAAGDVAAAFLNGVYIQRLLYMKQPRGGVRGLDPRQLLRVRKGVFGLTESPRLWFERFTSVITENKFQVDGEEYIMAPCPLDPCVYMLQKEEGTEPIAYVAVHVDDLLVIAAAGVNECVREQLSKLFPIDEWELDNFDYIGSHISKQGDEILINQEAFVDGRLFTLDIDPKADNEEEANEEQVIDNRSLVGALSWLAGQSRPDLQCGVALAQQRQRAPTVADLRFTNALAKKATEHRSEGVRLRPVPLEKGIFCAFHDAGWANADEQNAEEGFMLTKEEEEQRTIREGPSSTRKAKRTSSRVASQLGHVIMFANLEETRETKVKASLLEWRSQTCQRVCRSTFGAETMACAEGLECGQFLRALLATLLAGRLVKLSEARQEWPIICLTDCRSLHDHLHRVGVPRVPADRRLAVDLAAIRQDLRRKTERAVIQWLPTTCQVADPLTKPMRCKEWWEAQREGIRLPFDVPAKVLRGAAPLRQHRTIPAEGSPGAQRKTSLPLVQEAQGFSPPSSHHRDAQQKGLPEGPEPFSWHGVLASDICIDKAMRPAALVLVLRVWRNGEARVQVVCGRASVKPLDISLRAAQGLIDNMDDILPVHDSDQLDVNQAIFFRWNMLELLLHWVQFRGEWLDHMPSFTSRLLWQFYTCALPLRVFVLHIYRVFWPLLYCSLAMKYQVAEPYRVISDADLGSFSTRALVKRIALLQSLPACDRGCFLDLSAAFAALALQAGQRQQESELYGYLADTQLMLQSAFCESIIDCIRTRSHAELLRTTCGFLHRVAELPLVQHRRFQVLANPGEALGRTEFEGSHGATLVATLQNDDLWSRPFRLSPADEIEAACIDKMDMDPISPARALSLYTMLSTVGQVLSRFGVEWFASHGTLLGAIRHAGQIPHDCDLDISIFSSDLHMLRNASLMLALQRNGYQLDYLPVQNLFTVWRVGHHTGTEVRGARAVNSMNMYRAALHIFVLFDFHETKQWKYETDRIKHRGWIMSEKDLLPLKLRPFGDTSIPVPAQPEAYLDRMYGQDWNSTVRCMTALQEYPYYEPTPLTGAGMAQPTGPLEQVFYE
eukprot:s2167_g5.t2